MGLGTFLLEWAFDTVFLHAVMKDDLIKTATTTAYVHLTTEAFNQITNDPELQSAANVLYVARDFAGKRIFQYK